jgi:prophage regulatory protein
MPKQILRRPEVSRRTGLGRSALYAAIQAGRFPKQVKLSPRAVGWLEEEVTQWIEACAADRKEAGATQ